MHAVVTAGGRIAGSFRAATGQRVKALVEVDHRPLLSRVLTALDACPSVDRLAVVGPEATRPLAEKVRARWVPETGCAIENLLVGASAVEATGQILMVCSDLVASQAEDFEELLQRVPASAGVGYVVTSREEFEAAFPGHGRKRFVRLRDGRFASGSAFVLNVEAVQRVKKELRAMFLARKLPVVLASFFGTGLMVRFSLGQRLGGWLAPSTEELRLRIERALGTQTVIVRGMSPRLTFDIDTVYDWRFACRLFEQEPSAVPGLGSAANG